MLRKPPRPFHPPANRESYKDLLIFEERLKQNAERYAPLDLLCHRLRPLTPTRAIQITETTEEISRFVHPLHLTLPPSLLHLSKLIKILIDRLLGITRRCNRLLGLHRLHSTFNSSLPFFFLSPPSPILALTSVVSRVQYSLVHYSNIACLLVAATTLILFFATGMYSDKIAYAYK